MACARQIQWARASVETGGMQTCYKTFPTHLGLLQLLYPLDLARCNRELLGELSREPRRKYLVVEVVDSMTYDRFP